ncbi:MAG: spermine/spermidine synthase domain-containing protein [Pyrinomonadaceae bacterium]
MATLRDKGNVSLYLSHLRVLRKFSTRHHEVEIYEHPDLGVVLVLNGEIQHVEAWSPLYHEPLIHLPSAFIKSPHTALLLGGGSFFAVTEILKYRSIERVLMLDIDGQLIDRIAETYEHAATAIKDHRLEVRITDAFAYLDSQTERFDLVINDSVDLFRRCGEEVFYSLANLLMPEGVCSDVVYRHVFDDRGLRQTLQFLSKHYNTVASLVVAPEYPGVLHLLTLWSKNPALRQDRKRTINREQLIWARRPDINPCRYFDPRFLPYYLHLPQYVRDSLNKIT